MNQSFKKVAFFFFLGFGAVYLTADFLLHQGGVASETLTLVYKTFDMPFFFAAGMYFLALGEEFLESRYDIKGLSLLFIALGIFWTIFLISLNLGYRSLF